MKSKIPNPFPLKNLHLKINLHSPETRNRKTETRRQIDSQPIVPQNIPPALTRSKLETPNQKQATNPPPMAEEIANENFRTSINTCLEPSRLKLRAKGPASYQRGATPNETISPKVQAL